MDDISHTDSGAAESAKLQRLRTDMGVLRQRIAEIEGRTGKHQVLHEAYLGDQVVTLIEITNELSLAKSVDDLCFRAVQLARERLEFERLGIWFRRDENSHAVHGSFGVDDHGNIIDERHLSTELAAGSPDGRVLLSQEPLVIAEDIEGPTGQHEAQVYAAIWDGEHVIGHISMDNRLEGRPITARQCEMLLLLGSALGHLLTRKQAEEERETLINELKAALAEIKTLSGLIPICALCKKVRDDSGYWGQIETYIRHHSEAQFTHGYCPECAEKLQMQFNEQRHQDPDVFVSE